MNFHPLILKVGVYGATTLVVGGAVSDRGVIDVYRVEVKMRY
jgi:hypothetical protein